MFNFELKKEKKNERWSAMQGKFIIKNCVNVNECGIKPEGNRLGKFPMGAMQGEAKHT